MNNPRMKLVLVAVLCALSAWALSVKGIRLGKDLQGGVSLIYSVKVPIGQASDEVMGQVIDVLKRRVNPTGVLDIGMQPQGADRIEVVMPLPSSEVRALQLDSRRRQDEFLAKTQLSAVDLDAALMTGTAVSRFGAQNPSVPDLELAWQSLQMASSDLAALKTQGSASADQLGAVEDRIVGAELRVEALRNTILSRTLPPTKLSKALELSTAPTQVRDAAGAPVIDANGKPEMGPSPRAKELATITADFPSLAADLDALVAANDEYMTKRTGLDDPEDLMRLMRGAGVLDFRIAVSPSAPEGVNPETMRAELAVKGPRSGEPGVARWFKVNDLSAWYDKPAQLLLLEADPAGFFAGRGLVAGAFGGEIYILLYDSEAKSMTHSAGNSWALTNARVGTDELGRADVVFSLDNPGSQLMARFTTQNRGALLSIVLDDEVFNAATIQGVISSTGSISGNFGPEEIAYLTRVLTAGSLDAKVSNDPISISILGPSIGADNLSKGLEATVISVGITCVVMLIYYFGAGLVANIALAVNTLLIFGVMALVDGTFTLPGLAGVALSVAMAVDANVLIYERIREELELGSPLRAAIDTAYRRALSAIIDGNVTNLIVCLVLYKVGATEVKGFALTMSIGVITTLFTGLWVTRVLFEIMLNSGVKRLPMLPTVVPSISRFLLPTVDWVALRPKLFLGSGIVTVIALALFFARGNDIFETEFRGGVSMTLSTRPARSGEPSTSAGRIGFTRLAMEERVRQIGARAGDDIVVAQLKNANVLTVGEASADGLGSTFQIRVGNPTNLPSDFDETRISRDVQAAVVAELATDLDVRMPLKFTGSESTDHTAVTRPLEKALVGASIGRPDTAAEGVGEFRGGVAIVVADMTPPVTVADIAERITRMRAQPDWSSTAGRKTRVVGLEPSDPSNPSGAQKSVVILVSDPDINSFEVDLESWDRTLASPEWTLVNQALTRQASLDQVSSFSPIVAENLAASAVVAVILSLLGMLGYIWVRFGSFRFSTATVIGVAFNVIVCLGFLSISIPLSATAFGSALYIEEYRIDLNVVAGLLTIIGYALNDTIVILDRIRENRGKRTWISRETVNLSINQTFSRTVLTGGSTLATAIVLIILGGTGIRPFAYTFLIGLIAGTFSSVAIAAPMVYSRKEEELERARAAITPVHEVAQPV
ncbi:MAG: protein translocase subunit SecD [Planctomycetota bacterium]|nr:MAG: protein translocase subunit SecD [Planctomycetota bacterium]